MAFTRYGTLKTVIILQRMAETVCEAGAIEKNQTLHVLGVEVSLVCVFGMNTTLARVGSVFANKAGYYIYYDGKCPC